MRYSSAARQKLLGKSQGIAVLDYALTAFVTLIVVVDPVGIVPAFLSATHGLPDAARRGVGLRASVIAALILAGTALVGNWLLDRLGIGLPAFRISGGILLFVVAFEMVLGTRPAREVREAEQAIEEKVRDIAAFPVATPLIAGPGAITATLLLAGRTGSDPVTLTALIVIIAVVAALCAAAFAFAGRVAKLLGITGNVVLSRLLGVVLAALAVQFVIDGARTAFGQS
ncbi:multiple antibiotic resistance protein [Nitrobacteraceae bacterium AZCC 1564]